MWVKIINEITLPPNNIRVRTKIDDHNGVRNEEILTRKDNLYWCDDNTFVYYQPTHWFNIN